MTKRPWDIVSSRFSRFECEPGEEGECAEEEEGVHVEEYHTPTDAMAMCGDPMRGDPMCGDPILAGGDGGVTTSTPCAVRIEVCRFRPQGSFHGGRLMCTICSTVVGVRMATGKLRDPGCVRRCDFESELEDCMRVSQGMQITSGGRDMDQMKQISEAFDIACSGMNLRPKRVECFGPLFHSGASKEEMISACMPCDGNESGHLSAAEGCIIKGLDVLLQEDVLGGDGVVITTDGHSTYMYHSMGAPQRWYVFDSLDGTMVCVVGDGKAVHSSQGYKVSNDSTGLEGDSMYTAMILRGGVYETPTHPQHASSRNDIMERALEAIRSMGGGMGISIV